jgi:2-desacetyl-2-hydroxyethyl bacteriochlorophyllide A dehydrogenase
MRAARAIDGAISIVQVDEPTTDLVARVRAVGICGTDLGFLAMGTVGWTLGHELAVDVDGVTYALEPIYTCGLCEQCRAGYDNRCTGPHGNLGIFEDGGLAELVRVPQRRQLTALPAGLSPADASLVETAGVAYRGVRLARIEPGERVCVVGGGSIGLMAAACVRARGHAVAVDARHPHQRAAAERLGASVVSDTSDAHARYDVVIDSAGSDSGVARCFDLVAPGGRIVLLGVYHGLVAVPGLTMLMKEVQLIASMAYAVDDDGEREFANAALMLAGDPEIAATIVTHRFPLADAAEAFRVAGDRSAGAIKVVVEPS